MQITDITPTIAELAAALAGFSAIIVALRKKPVGEWHPFDRFNLRILLQVAALTIVFSIFPFGALVLFDADLAWKVSIIVYGFVHLVDVSSFVLNLPPEARPLNRVLSGIGLVVSIAQISIGFLGGTNSIQAMYLASLAWHLVVSAAGFVFLIYIPSAAVTSERDK